jgi:hypothetical protein
MKTNKTRQMLDSFDKRLQLLSTERSYMMDYWGELADYHLATRGQFLTRNSKKPKRNTKQYNNTSRLASRTLASGMMAGITSPARPWFKLSASSPELNEIGAVKEWLHTAEVYMYRVFSQSNTYNCLHALYSELGVFGVGAMGVYEDYDNIINCKTYTIGSYMLGTGAQDRVDTFYREYTKTVGQLVKEFGEDAVSTNVLDLWKRGSTETEIDIVHAIEPNDNRDSLSPLARDMEFRSAYYERAKGTAGKGGKVESFLRQSGFQEFPIMAPRWDVRGEEVYSEDCPGMVSLGDSKALQLGERRKYQALDKLSNPPLQGDSGLKSQTNGGAPNPGDIIWLTQNSQGFKSVYEGFQPRLDYIMQLQNEVQDRINKAFYVDLFLMLANSDRRQITAREVAEKHEEKLLMLGPVLERLHAELLDPLINRTFNILQRNGVLPEPPSQLVDSDMTIEYVSVMAQAQRMVGISGLERTVGFAMSMAQVWPTAAIKIDPMQVIDEYAHAAGVNPRIVRPDEEAEEIMAAQAEQAAKQQQAMQAQQTAQTAQIASQTDTSGQNALTDMMRNAGLQ